MNFLVTHHATLLGMEGNRLVQTCDPTRAWRFESFADLACGLARCLPASQVFPVGDGTLLLASGQCYVTAQPDGSVVADRMAAQAWECFRIADEAYVAALCGPDAARLATRVEALRTAGAPVLLHLACGWSPVPGFLNIDLACHAPDFARDQPDSYFLLPTAGVRIPLPDSCVDYIFHEDFIEHIGQLDQVIFLAETLRLLKSGGIHRVNTPNLAWTMRSRSNFAAGAEGVYQGERQWEHIALFTPAHLEEMARLVGYREVRFTARSAGTSPHAIADRRPYADRCEIEGNIFADLVK